MSEEQKELETLAEGVPVKRCSKCGRILPLDEFPIDKYMRDGHRSTCRDCYTEYAKEYYQRKKKSVVMKASDFKAMAPTRPVLAEELASKPLGQCTHRELMSVLKMWGFTGELTWTRTIDLSTI